LNLPIHCGIRNHQTCVMKNKSIFIGREFVEISVLYCAYSLGKMDFPQLQQISLLFRGPSKYDGG